MNDNDALNSAPAHNLLNEHQRRRLGSRLRLLRQDLGNVVRLAALAPGAPAGRIEVLVGRIEGEIDALRARFGLGEDEPTPLRRHVTAIAEVWWARVEDLRARRLKAHGTVHPDLATALDPHVERLEDLLVALAQEAAQLPETMV